MSSSKHSAPYGQSSKDQKGPRTQYLPPETARIHRTCGTRRCSHSSRSGAAAPVVAGGLGLGRTFKSYVVFNNARSTLDIEKIEGRSKCSSNAQETRLILGIIIVET